ncbi:MAG: glycosyl transferase, partial [Bacteroidota bacterium]
QTWRELISQKHRWGKGGLDMKFSGFLIMAVGFAQHALILIGPLYGSVFAALTGWLLKATGDYVFLHRVLKKVNQPGELKYFHHFQLYYLLYVLILPFMVFFGRKVVWKGRSY